MIPEHRKSIKRTCANCGNRKCRRKWLAVCWLQCVEWIKEVLPLDVVTTFSQKKGKPPD